MGFRTAVIQASLGGVDHINQNVPQTIQHDYRLFTDENYPPRNVVMSARLQAKIPKFFGWQMAPSHDYYLWQDGNITLNRPETLQYFLDEIKDHDIVVLRHHRRPNIRQEVRYLRKGLREQSMYLVNRYNNEQWKEQYDLISRDKEYTDDLLVIGGIFMYRNTPEVQAMLKEWFYHCARYNVQDQISFPYVLKKSGIRVRVLEHDYTKWDYIKQIKHKNR